MKGERLDAAIFSLAKGVAASTQNSDLVIAVDDADPVVLYRCGRKGWHSLPDMLTRDFVESKKQLGAKYIVGTKERFEGPGQQHRLQELLSLYRVVENADAFFIVKL